MLIKHLREANFALFKMYEPFILSESYIFINMEKNWDNLLSANLFVFGATMGDECNMKMNKTRF